MSKSPQYSGPLSLEQAKSKLLLTPLDDSRFRRDGPRAFVEYRDLGMAEASDGRIAARHIRAILPFDEETGWHWHDMTAHFVYILKGWVEFEFDGIPDPVRVIAGSCLSQPAGVAHNVVRQSDDLELIEINMPADYVTIEGRLRATHL